MVQTGIIVMLAVALAAALFTLMKLWPRVRLAEEDAADARADLKAESNALATTRSECDIAKANLSSNIEAARAVNEALLKLATPYGVIVDGTAACIGLIKARVDHSYQDWANRLQAAVEYGSAQTGEVTRLTEEVAKLNSDLNLCQQESSVRLHRIEELEAQATAPAYTDETTKLLVDEFLKWPLPESVCVDPCAARSGESGRVGTNLLTAEEAGKMFEVVVRPIVLRG